MDRDDIFSALGLASGASGTYAAGWVEAGGTSLESVNPATGQPIGSIAQSPRSAYDQAVASAEEAFAEWRMLPAPKRGDYVRQIGNARLQGAARRPGVTRDGQD